MNILERNACICAFTRVVYRNKSPAACIYCVEKNILILA